MEDEENKVPASDPVQKDVDAIEGTDIPLGATTKEDTTPITTDNVVAEPDHTTELMDKTAASATYNYNSESSKTKDVTYESTSVTGNGTSVTKNWDANYESEAQSVLDAAGAESKFVTQAKEYAQDYYDIEAAQAKYESIESRKTLNENATKAWNTYFSSEYTARQTQDKMGWTGGQKQASDLQIDFLKAETASNMYTADEAQRYGVKTKLGIAKMYADEEMKEKASEYYQQAVQAAINEANITGVYIPAEAQDVMAQAQVAKSILENDNATEAEKARATDIKNACELYYQSEGFEPIYNYHDESTRVTLEDGTVITKTIKVRDTEPTYNGIKTLARINAEAQFITDALNSETAIVNANTAIRNAETSAKSAASTSLYYSIQNKTLNYTQFKDTSDSLLSTAGTYTTDGSNYYVNVDGTYYKIAIEYDANKGDRNITTSSKSAYDKYVKQNGTKKYGDVATSTEKTAVEKENSASKQSTIKTLGPNDIIKG